MEKFIQFPTGWVPAGLKSCGTELVSPWQNLFHDAKFPDEAFSDSSVWKSKVFEKFWKSFDFFTNLKKNVRLIEEDK